MEKHRSPAIRDKVVLWAREIIEHKDQFVILDTETTGLNRNDVIVQIAMVDLNGNELLNSLVKPTKRKRISAEASAIHGINISHLQDAPTFAELKPIIDKIVAGKTVLIYNAEYDERLINQTTKQDGCFSPHLKTECVMKHYSWFVGDWSDYHLDYNYQKLPSGDHSAIGDCRATLEVINKIAQSELMIPSKPETEIPAQPAMSMNSNSLTGFGALKVNKEKKWWQIWK